MATHDDTQPAARGRMLEYAEFVEDQVARACARIKSNDVFRASLWLITVGLAVLFLEIVLDHTLELPMVVRRSIFFGGLLVAAIYGGLRIVRPMFMRVNDLYAAKSIESVDPHFKNSLINYLRLREDADKIPPSVLKSIEARAVNDLSAVNVDDVIDPSPVTRLSYALAAIVVGLCLYSWITPKNIWDSARRAFLADVARPTNTRFANVSPGDDPEAPRIVTGLPVSFSVETLGAQPDTVTLFTSRDGGKSFAETPMNKGRTFADPWTVTIDKAPGDMQYYMAGGDGKTRTYKFEAMPVAIVESVSLDYDFPAYAQAPRREGVTDGNVDALQGTRITVTATTNQPARSGLLDFGPRPPVTLAPIPGEPKKLKGTFVVDANGQYSVRFNTVDGQTNPEPVLYDIRVVKDVPPTARFIRPESPTTRPANARVPLVVEASDDFGITSAMLHVYKGGEILQQAVELIDPKSKETVKQIQSTIALDLKQLSLRDGDRIQYWLALKDNCDIQPNRFETAKQEIVIQPPVSEPERDQLAQNEMAQAKEDLGQEEPQQGDQAGQSGQSGDEQKGQENQNENQTGNQTRSGDEEKKDESGKNSQNKSGQGNASESANPSENAKSGGSQGKGQQAPSDDAATKGKPQSKGQSGKGDSRSDSDSTENESDSSKSGSTQKKGGDRSKDQPKDDTQKSSTKAGSESTKNDSRNESGDDRNEGLENKGEQQAGSQDRNSEKSNQRQPGSKETGKAEPGRKPDATERSEGNSDPNDPSQSERKDSQRPSADERSKGESSDQEKSSQQAKNGISKDGKSPSQKNSENPEQGDRKDLPNGEPEASKSSENSKQRSLDDLTQEDRDKLDRLRKALGMDNESKPAQDQPNPEDQNQPNDPGSKNDGSKGEPENQSAQEKSAESKSGGSEKGDQSKSGGQEKSEQSKSGGTEKGEESKSGSEEKSAESKSGGAEKSDSSKSGGQEKGEQSKSGGTEKGEESKSGSEEKSAESKSGGAEKSDSSKSGGQEKGEQSKSGDADKGAQSKSGGQEKGAQSKSGGQEKGAESKSGSEDKGESGKQQGDQQSESGDPKGKGESEEGGESKSKEAGEDGGKPGGTPETPPKSGGMRKGSSGSGTKDDTTQPSPRSAEPENATRDDVTTQQKADQRLLNRLRQMVEKDEITKDVEQATGLSREEIDQFVRRYEAPTEDLRNRDQQGSDEIVTGPGGDDREKRVTLPGETPDGKVLSRTGRNAGMVQDDEIRGNLEGARSRVPSALRARFEAYQKGLSKSPATGGAGASGGNTGTGSGTNR
jgi:hypothetical protein